MSDDVCKQCDDWAEELIAEIEFEPLREFLRRTLLKPRDAEIARLKEADRA